MNESLLQQLKDFGYCVVPFALEMDIDDGENLGDINYRDIKDWLVEAGVGYETHGVVKHHQVGHQAFQWRTRTASEIYEPFEAVYETEDLVVSFDGIGYVPPGSTRRDTFWMHTDQDPSGNILQDNFKCVQGVVSLTSNYQNTFKCVPGSHKLHETYFKNKYEGDLKRGNFHKLDSPQDYERHTGETYYEKVVPLEAGDLLMFDSRLFHQNQQGYDEERLVQYVSYRPRSGLSKSQKAKRLRYFLEKRSTSHWAYPVKVNGLQPRTYGDQSKLIDYSKLPELDLDELVQELPLISDFL